MIVRSLAGIPEPEPPKFWIDRDGDERVTFDTAVTGSPKVFRFMGVDDELVPLYPAGAEEGLTA